MSLQVWLPLNGNLNNQGLVDWKPTLQNGTTSAYVNGKIGKALNTGGIIMPANITKQILNNNEFSYTCWIYVNGANDSTSERSMIFGNNDQTGHLGGRQFSLFQYPTANDFHWSFYNYDGTNYTVWATATLTDVLPSYQWTHIAISYKKPILNIYINGENKVHWTDKISNASSFEFDTQLIHNSSYHYLNDIRLYNHALSEKEIKEISKGLVLHYKLSNFGNENLISNFDTSFLSYSNGTTTLFTNQMNGGTQEIVSNINGAEKCIHLHSLGGNNRQYRTLSAYAGKTYTISADYYSTNSQSPAWRGELNGGDYSWSAINTSYTTPGKWQRLSYTYNNLTSDATIYFFIYCANGQDCYVKNIKIEEGDKSTPWLPNSTDSFYNKLGLNNSIEYDCSGYGNDGTKNNITTSSDSARYSMSYVFNGSNAYIKTNGSLWRSDGATELSINFWASMDDWTTFNARLYSCTEGGGYNVEPSGSNISFSMNAYTDAAKSAYKYINDGGYCAVAKSSLASGWHMFTYVYTTSGTKLYVDGNLKVNNTYTSYGVHYNATAPLIIGGEATGSGATSPYFNGKMSDFKLFATALSADDVKELYQVSASIDNMGNLYSYEVVEQ